MVPRSPSRTRLLFAATLAACFLIGATAQGFDFLDDDDVADVAPAPAPSATTESAGDEPLDLGPIRIKSGSSSESTQIFAASKKPAAAAASRAASPMAASRGADPIQWGAGWELPSQLSSSVMDDDSGILGVGPNIVFNGSAIAALIRKRLEAKLAKLGDLHSSEVLPTPKTSSTKSVYTKPSGSAAHESNVINVFAAEPTVWSWTNTVSKIWNGLGVTIASVQDEGVVDEGVPGPDQTPLEKKQVDPNRMNVEQAAAVGSRLSSDQTRLAEDMIAGEVLLDKTKQEAAVNPPEVTEAKTEALTGKLAYDANMLKATNAALSRLRGAGMK